MKKLHPLHRIKLEHALDNDWLTVETEEKEGISFRRAEVQLMEYNDPKNCLVRISGRNYIVKYTIFRMIKLFVEGKTDL